MSNEENNVKIDVDEELQKLKKSPVKRKARKGAKRKNTNKVSASKVEKQNESVEEANEASEQRFNSGISPARINREEGSKIGKKSWQPPNTLYISEDKKDENMAYRGLRRDDANLQRKISQGWEIDQSGLSTNARSIDGGYGMGGASIIGDLVLAKMPKEMKQQRTEYYQGKLKSAKERAEELKQQGGKTTDGDDVFYGRVESSRL